MGKCITSCGKDKARCCTDDCFLRVAEGSRLRDLKYNNIESCNTFFDMFVIRLKKK